MFETLTAQFTPLDWVFITWMLFSILLGLIRGFISEVMSLIGWILAFALAQHYALTASAAMPLPPAIKDGASAFMIGFLAIFLGVLLVWTMVRTLLRFAVGKGCFDYLLGLVFGLVRGYIVAMLALSLISLVLPLPNFSWWQKAYFHGVMDVGVNQIRAILPQEWSERLQINPTDLPVKIGPQSALPSTPNSAATATETSPSLAPTNPSTLPEGAVAPSLPSFAPLQFPNINPPTPSLAPNSSTGLTPVIQRSLNVGAQPSR